MNAAGYARPGSLDEATRLLAARPHLLLAGGTDVYPAHVGREVEAAVLDLGGVDGLRGIARDDGAGPGGWRIGATTTWSDVLAADLPPLFDGLKAAAREVGGVQIQNTATVAGNVCNASPAADGVPALLALDAEVVLASTAGERRLPLARFIRGARRTERRDDELVTALVVPGRVASARSAFLKLGARRHLVISIVMASAVCEVDDEGVVRHAAVAVGSCSAVAKRLPRLERRLLGARAGSVAVEADDLAPLTPLDDIRGSAAYRLDAATTLVGRLLRALA